MQTRHLVTGFIMVLAVNAATVLAEDAGKQDFLAHCSSCHGIDGKGRGPMYLTTETKPSDLTLLSQSHSGNFPYVQVRQVIDGRVDKGNSRSHLHGDMPVWGEVFVGAKGNSPEAKMHGEALAKMRILNIVDYLVSIQRQCVGACE